MKLYLASHGLPPPLQSIFVDLIGGPNQTVAWINNAKDPVPLDQRTESVLKTQMPEAGLTLEEIDLRDYYGTPELLKKKLRNYPAAWIGGGNVFYLRYAMRESGFDQIIHNLLENGMVYAGASAGAIVAGPSLDGFEFADKRDEAPEHIREGLGLTDISVIPHWGSERYGELLDKVHDVLEKDGRDIVTISDEQALVIVDERIERHG